MKYLIIPDLRGVVRWLLGIAAASLLTACATQHRDKAPETEPVSVGEDGMSLEEQRRIAWENFDHDACEAKGGEGRQEGMLGMPRCNIPYADAGQSCRDGSDCEGRCLGHDDVTDYQAPPGQAKGVCQATDSPFGCYAEIDAGTVTPMICVD